jgi:hypothetical protein
LNRDFTVKKYNELLDALKKAGYEFQTVEDYVLSPLTKVVILRHDIDKMPLNALEFAKLEKSKELYATYYFRIVPKTFVPSIIREIAALGHNIGYHYEDVDLTKGDIDKGYISFKTNLEKLRKMAPVKTICMHGSPLSRYDNKRLWDKYNYRDEDIICEPYLDVDFNKVLYLTDTGRRWNNDEVSIRDKVHSAYNLQIKNTNQLINLIQENKLPEQIMINTHPQRWNDNIFYWIRELLAQSVKNQIKKIIVKQTNQL